MKLFISWSNQISRESARALRDWIPSVIQEVTPWMSEEDIEIGTRWSMELAKELSESALGIICLTPENLQSPWVLFEAGALSRVVERTLVIPYLIGVGTQDIANSPLGQYQAANSDKNGTLKLLNAINRNISIRKLPEEKLKSYFEKWWPELEEKLLQIKSKLKSVPKPYTKPVSFFTSEFQFFRTRAKNERRGDVILRGGKENDVAYLILRTGHFLNKFEDFVHSIHYFNKIKGTKLVVIVPEAKEFLDSLGGGLTNWITELYENSDCKYVRALVLEQKDESLNPKRNEGYIFITDGENLENDEGFRSLSSIAANFFIGYVKSLMRAGLKIEI